ncbi:wat1-related protein [Quercus suber]|uniref:Wat1-related protein n=1 Tax=Quercus suber TaxID=58331 RepID=A0AAW0KRH1_QUESU
MARRYCYKDVLPFSGMVAAECINVGLNILFKASTLKGLSYYVFILYSSAIRTLVLLPFPLASIFRRFLGQLCGYKGIEFSSPTLASAISNLTPAWTYILAVIFRMENLALRSSITQVKIIGTLVSISGALVVVFYKGPTIISPSQSLSLSLHSPRGTSETKWVIETVVVFLYVLCTAIISAPVCLMAERNLHAWTLRPDVTLVTILYSGFFGSSMSIVIAWALHLKGPVYVSIFKPLSIVIAAAMGVIFLGDALYLGSLIGAIILSIGFYAVIWAKAKEELSLGSSPDDKTPFSNPTFFVLTI